MLTRGKLSVEIVMTEKPGDARLIVYPFVDGKPADKGVTVSGTLVRYDRSHEPLRFDAAGQKFVSAQSIGKPHVFDATIDVKAGNESASFPFARADGAIALTDAQLATSKIALAKAGPRRSRRRSSCRARSSSTRIAPRTSCRAWPASSSRCRCRSGRTSRRGRCWP